MSCSRIRLEQLSHKCPRIRARPVSFTYNLADEKTVPVNQESHGMAGNLIVVSQLSFGIVKDRETQLELFLKIFHQVLRFFKTDRQYCQTLLFELVKQLILGGQLPPAIRSKRFKDSQQNSFTPEIRKAHGLAVNLRQGKRRRSLRLNPDR